MASPSSIPQEIIDQIINEASDDWESLNACSRVSRSFLSTSRKGLFHAVSISSEITARGLHNLLFSNPSIANYVQELTIVPHPKQPRSLLAGIPWVVLDKKLAPILSVLSRVSYLQLGDDTSHLFDWTFFPAALQLALGAYIRGLSSPSILKVFHISELPPFLFLAPISELTLFEVNIADTDTNMLEKALQDNTPAMAQLVSLDLLVYDFHASLNTAWPILFRRASNLRHLSILTTRNSEDHELCLAQRIIGVTTTSLNSIACLVHDDDLCPLLGPSHWSQLNLGIISNLTDLSFTFTSLSTNENPPSFRTIVDILKNPFVTRNLEVLTFAFEMTCTTCMWESRVVLCSRYNAWDDFNSIFEDGPGIPTLRILKIYLYLTESPLRVADVKLQSLLISKLPGLDEEVTLSCVTYSNPD